MGSNVSTASSSFDSPCPSQDLEQDDNHQLIGQNSLFFPPEILCQIITNFTPRDKLVARQVCRDWNEFITFNSGLESQVSLVVQDGEDRLIALLDLPAASSIKSFWKNYLLRNVDLSKKSSRFWTSFQSDHITKLSFVNCAIIELSDSNCGDGNGNCAQLGCKNLRSLSMNNCDKYFMTGNDLFVQIHKILDLENLVELDLSDNSYLTDRILFSFLTKIKALVSLNLANCAMTTASSLFQRFYPSGTEQLSYPNDCSDYILSFQMLYYGYLSYYDGRNLASSAKKLTELNLSQSGVDKDALKSLSKFKWGSIVLRRCTEIKDAHLLEFLETQHDCIEKLEVERMKITESAFSSSNLRKLTHLVVRECTDMTTLEFLRSLVNLEHLDISFCTSINFEAGRNILSSLHNLKVLRMRGMVPFYNHNFDLGSISQLLADEFQKLNQLLELDIGMCGSIVNDDVLQSIIYYMPSLKVLKICKSPMTDLGMTGRTVMVNQQQNPPCVAVATSPIMFSLSRLNALRELSLTQCEFIGEITWILALRFPSLKYLDVSRCLNLSKIGLLEILRNCRCLEELVISNSVLLSHQTQVRCFINRDEEIQAAVKDLPRLREFRICS